MSIKLLSCINLRVQSLTVVYFMCDYFGPRLARLDYSRCSRHSLSAMTRALFFEPRDLAMYSRVSRHAFVIYEFMLERFATVTQETVTWKHGCKYVDYFWHSDEFPYDKFQVSTKQRPNLE